MYTVYFTILTGPSNEILPKEFFKKGSLRSQNQFNPHNDNNIMCEIYSIFNTKKFSLDFINHNCHFFLNYSDVILIS